MARDIDYDDRNLQQLFADLEPKRRLQAVKGGFRKEANRVRKTAINNLRSSIRTDKDLEKGVRAIVFKRKAGFRVTVGTKKAGKNGKGEAGFHTNRQGLLWFAFKLVSLYNYIHRTPHKILSLNYITKILELKN